MFRLLSRKADVGLSDQNEVFMHKILRRGIYKHRSFYALSMILRYDAKRQATKV